MSSKTAVVLFTRDLRVTDNPALWAASRAERTVPLFVLDDAILGSRFAAPNRVAYMREALIDLDGRLKAMDGRLFLRRGAGGRGGDEGRARMRRRRSSTSPPTGAATRGGARRRCGEACAEGGIELTAHPGIDDPRPRRGDADRRRPLQGLQPLPPGLERGAVARGGRRRRASWRCRAARRGRAAGAGRS